MTARRPMQVSTPGARTAVKAGALNARALVTQGTEKVAKGVTPPERLAAGQRADDDVELPHVRDRVPAYQHVVGRVGLELTAQGL